MTTQTTRPEAGKKNVITANALLSGRIVWWAGTGAEQSSADRWVTSLAQAHIMDEAEADKELALATADAGRDKIIGAYKVVVQSDKDDRFVPLTMRERIRAFGPSVESANMKKENIRVIKGL